MLAPIVLGNQFSYESNDFPTGHKEMTLITETEEISEETYQLLSKYVPSPHSSEVKEINLPWILETSDLLEWWIEIEYNGEIFQKQVPVSIFDFKEKFLKHPDYGEIISFDVDDDPEDDIEVIAGFYWSIIKDEQGNDVNSLEKRIRVRQLESGDYLQDTTAEFQIWSELHVNYGLIKKESHVHSFFHLLQEKTYGFEKVLSLIKSLLEFLPLKIVPEHSVLVTEEDSDYIVVGVGYRSPEGEDIPRYAEKRFACARENLFSPSLFQHQMDPGSSKGKGPFEILYGFKTFHEGASNPLYDIAFSIEFNPAVSLKTKFIPLEGQVYYFFEEESQQNTETAITFTSNVFAGNAEDIELRLLFDEIDETLGQLGRWMKIDIDVLGDHDLLAGKFSYEASHIFDVGVVLDSPFFEEKIEIMHLPKSVDVSWDLDFILTPTPTIYAHAEGFLNLSMSSSLGGINLYYPKTNPEDVDQIFIDVPEGIPQSVRIDAAATVNVDVTDLQSSENYVYGNIRHTCDENIQIIRAFLPGEENPIVKVTEIPAYSEAKGKLYWNRLQGYAYIWRGSHGPADPIELNVEYKGFAIHDVLTIRNGHIETRFKVAETGNFYFDTTEGIFGNHLQVSNADSGDSLALTVDEVSADELQAEWSIDTSGESLKINDLHFGGMIDVIDALHLDLSYQGKTTSLDLDWEMGQTGGFEVFIDQQEDFTLDFSDFALNSSDIDFGGIITIAEDIRFDLSWDLKQGSGSGQGSVDPGFFAINKNNDVGIIKSFDFYVTYQDQYGVQATFNDLQFYLNLEWWKGDRLLPYIWLDYEVSADDFDVDLLWTNQDGETQWYENVEEW